VGGFREILEHWGKEGGVGIHQAMNFFYQTKSGKRAESQRFVIETSLVSARITRFESVDHSP
jgi:hypothetical protein